MATSDIANSCGFAEEKLAFGDHHVRLAHLEAAAHAAAVKLARVYDRDQTDIYQGESIRAVVHGAVALLGSCGLPHAQAPLRRALAAHR